MRSREHDAVDSKGKRLCRYVRNGDMCPYGESCNFSHEPSKQESEQGKRMLIAGLKRLREEREEAESSKKHKKQEMDDGSELMKLMVSTLR